MKRLAISALSLLLLTGLPARAAPPDNGQANQDDNAKKHKPQGGGQQGRPEGQKPGTQGKPGGQKPATTQKPQNEQHGQPGGQKPVTTQKPQNEQHGQPGGQKPVTTQKPRNEQHGQPGGQKPVITQKPQNDQHGQPDRQKPGSTQRGAKTERYSGPHDYKPGQRPSNWNKGPRQFNPRDYHHNYQAERRYHWRPYVRPHGWYDHRWTYGERLPAFFWVRNYWITDFWMFGLAIPPYGYEWVRYGDDALLIDTNNGVVLQVVYGIFY